ncbi:hypothetical protein [Novosphingobium terrae]|uniref:hypothetical protein n=1 Tax=Novosphingobium terrae TaxID=2726189 RepID=UPI0019801DF8|nr:hypothetical protein [Novosphingobium terrae]
MAKQFDLTAFHDWLSDKHPWLAAAIVSRMSLRLVPYSLLGFPNDSDDERTQQMLFARLRHQAIVRAALRSPDPKAARDAVQRALNDQHDFHPNRKVFQASRFALQAADAAIEGRTNASLIALSAARSVLDLEGMFEAVTDDCRWCDAHGDDALGLLNRPLWATPRPGWFEASLGGLYGFWLAGPDSWSCWNHWYDWRLDGQPNEWGLPPGLDRQMIARLIAADDDFWQVERGGLKRVNDAIMEWGVDLQAEAAEDIYARDTESLSLSLDEVEGGVQSAQAPPVTSEKEERDKAPSARLIERVAGKPRAWRDAIALRMVLRSLPLGLISIPLRENRPLTFGIAWPIFPAGLLMSALIRYDIDGVSLGGLKAAILHKDQMTWQGNGVFEAFEHVADAMRASYEADALRDAAKACEAAVAVFTSAIDEFKLIAAGELAHNPGFSAVVYRFSEALKDIRAEMVRVQLWGQVDADLKALSDGMAVDALIDSPLWWSTQPEWSLKLWRGVRAPLEEGEYGHGLWTAWYDRRLAGKPTSFDFPSQEADLEFHRRFFAQPPAWWRAPVEQINAEIGGWIEELRRVPPEAGELADDRPGSGMPVSSSLEVIPQSEVGLTFKQGADGAFEIDELAGASSLSTTREARDSHDELKDTLDDAIRLCVGHNQATSLIPILSQIKELMGAAPVDLRIGRFMQRAERGIKLAEAMAIELRSAEDLSRLPNVTREIVVVLEAIPTAYWAMVHADPRLEQRLRDLSEKSFQPDPSPTIGELGSVIRDSVEDGVLSSKAAGIVEEMAEGLDDTAALDTRRAQRYFETVKNLPLAVFSSILRNRGKIASGIVAGAGALATAVKSIEILGRWVASHSDLLHKLFANYPGINHLIDELVAAAKFLPPG